MVKGSSNSRSAVLVGKEETACEPGSVEKRALQVTLVAAILRLLGAVEMIRNSLCVKWKS
jgi:hypothetical protein